MRHITILLLLFVFQTACKSSFEKAMKHNDESDFEKARVLALEACEKAEAGGCSLLAWLWKNGEGGAVDMEKARDNFLKACHRDRADACNEAGIMWFAGLGGKRDGAEARHYFEKACIGGNAAGCNNLGAMWFAGDGGLPNKPKAADYFDKACEGSDARACDTLGELWLWGKGVSEDRKKSRAFYSKACDLGDAKGCFDHRQMWSWGEGGPKDKEKANQLDIKVRKLADEECDAGNSWSCIKMAEQWRFGHGGEKDEAKARQYFLKACDMGDGAGCLFLAGMYEKGLGGPKDLGKADELNAKGFSTPVPKGSPEVHDRLSHGKKPGARKPEIPEAIIAASGKAQKPAEKEAGPVVIVAMAPEKAPGLDGAQAPVWLAVTRPMFEKALEPLAQERRKQGFEVIVSTEDPAKAVKGIEGRLPLYIVLVGDATDKAGKMPWHVPTKKRELYRWKHTQSELFSTDSLWGDLDHDLVPDVPVGRIPVRSEKELELVVKKILDYENRRPGPNDLRLPVWTGTADYDPMIDSMAAGLAIVTLKEYTPAWLSPWLLAGDKSSPVCAWPTRQVAMFNREYLKGGALVGLIGHSSKEKFHSMDFQGRSIDYGADDAANALSSARPGPAMVILACDAGSFTEKTPGLAESLLMIPGGPVAVIGATTQSHPLTNYYSAVALLGVLKGKDRRIGSLWLSTQQAALMMFDPIIEGMLAEVEGSLENKNNVATLKRDHLLMYALLGDPATRMHLPDELSVKAESRDGAWHWEAAKPKGAETLYVDFRPTGLIFPAPRDIGQLGEEASLEKFEKANATYTFGRLSELTADKPWKGVANKKGTLRLTATGPHRIYTTTLHLP